MSLEHNSKYLSFCDAIVFYLFAAIPTIEEHNKAYRMYRKFMGWDIVERQ